MKKLGLLVMPLMTISLLASCGGSKPGPTPPEPTKYTLTVNCTDCTPSGNESSYEAGANVSFTITPDATYVLPEKKDVKVTGVTDFNYTIISGVATFACIMPAEEVKVTITATPEPSHIRYTLNASCINGNIYGALPKYYKDQKVELHITSTDGYVLPPSVYYFAELEGIAASAITYTVEHNISATLTFKMPANEVTIIITAYDPIDIYTLTTTCNNGTVTGNQEVYTIGAEVALTFTPNQGYVLPPSKDDIEFTGIIDKSKVNYDNETGSVTFKMPPCAVSITITAVNPSLIHTLTATCDNGTVTGNRGEYVKGTNVVLTFTANSSYALPKSIDEITITGIAKSEVTYDSASGSITFIMPDGDVTIAVTATKIWYLDEEYIAGLTESDIGTTQTLKVNGVDHTVRLIGIDHDELSDDSGHMAHTTWEFANLLSDKDGYSLATVWNWENGGDSTNYDFSHSNLRKSLDDEGDAQLSWYQKENVTKSTTYTGSVLSMLPSDLQGMLKEVKKPIGSGSSYEVKTCATKVFPLSYREMTEETSSDAKEEGTTYAYYQGSGNSDANRIKHQVKWHDGAASTYTEIDDGKYSEAHNFAGYNMAAEGAGGHYWLRSPSAGIDDANHAWTTHSNGELSNKGGVYDTAYAVAPAFCLGEETWYLDEKFINGLTENDIGTIKTLKVNGINQKVRLIGIDHDELSDNSGNYAHTTWEFVDLLSDSEGYSLATSWDWDASYESTNYDYRNSNIRKAFDGGGDAQLSWYQKGSATKSTTYTGSVLSMLPSDLQGVLKEVKKQVATTSSYTVDTYDTKVFPLSYREMTEETSSDAKEEGSTYSFYKGDDDDNRIKHQVKWHDGAVTTFTQISDSPPYGLSYAGYNSNEKEEYGGISWLRSPATCDENDSAWTVEPDGTFFHDKIGTCVYAFVHSVAPAFCI